MREVLMQYLPQIEASDVLDRLELSPRGYFLVSAHREENVDSPERLGALLDCLEAVQTTFNLPVIVSTHPRTRKRLDALGRSVEGVSFHEPVSYTHLDVYKRQDIR